MNEANAKRLLFEVADLLEDVGIEFFLYAGTCLGATRENKFIETDRDIDLGVMSEDLLPLTNDIESRLIERGIKLTVLDHRHKRPWDGSIYGFKFYGYGEHGDLVGFTKIKGKRAVPSHVGDHWLVHTARFLEELGEIEFYGRIFKIPRDTDGLLTELYGNWKVPVKNPNCELLCKKSEFWAESIR